MEKQKIESENEAGLINQFNRISWDKVQTFFSFIFCGLMYIQNKGLQSFIMEEKKQEKEYSRQDKKDQNQTLEKMITTMDEVLKFKKSFYEKGDSTYYFGTNPSGGHR